MAKKRLNSAEAPESHHIASAAPNKEALETSTATTRSDIATITNLPPSAHTPEVQQPFSVHTPSELEILYRGDGYREMGNWKEALHCYVSGSADTKRMQALVESLLRNKEGAGLIREKLSPHDSRLTNEQRLAIADAALESGDLKWGQAAYSLIGKEIPSGKIEACVLANFREPFQAERGLAMSRELGMTIPTALLVQHIEDAHCWPSHAGSLIGELQERGETAQLLFLGSHLMKNAKGEKEPRLALEKALSCYRAANEEEKCAEIGMMLIRQAEEFSDIRSIIKKTGIPPGHEELMRLAKKDGSLEVLAFVGATDDLLAIAEKNLQELEETCAKFNAQDKRSPYMNKYALYRAKEASRLAGAEMDVDRLEAIAKHPATLRCKEFSSIISTHICEMRADAKVWLDRGDALGSHGDEWISWNRIHAYAEAGASEKLIHILETQVQAKKIHSFHVVGILEALRTMIAPEKLEALVSRQCEATQVEYYAKIGNAEKARILVEKGMAAGDARGLLESFKMQDKQPLEKYYEHKRGGISIRTFHDYARLLCEQGEWYEMKEIFESYIDEPVPSDWIITCLDMDMQKTGKVVTSFTCEEYISACRQTHAIDKLIRLGHRLLAAREREHAEMAYAAAADLKCAVRD